MRRSFNERALRRARMSKAVAIFLIGAISLSYVVLTSGCAGRTPAPKWSEMSPKQQATMILGVYNDQYDLYLREATSPNLTDDKRSLLREKKKALVEMYPYLKIYSDYAADGQFAPADVEIAVMTIMDRLLGI